MTSKIDELRKSLRDVLTSSDQSRYGRRAPPLEIIKRLMDIERKIDDLDIATADSYDLRSLVYENLLDFDKSIEYLSKAIENSDKGARKRFLKRLAALETQKKFWNTLRLTPRELEQLGCFIDDSCDDFPDHSDPFVMTKAWLCENKPEEAREILDALPRLGANNDVQVVLNVALAGGSRSKRPS